MNGPESLTEEYHRARRNLNVVSALLFAWELIGIRLGTSKDPEVLGVPIVLKSPDAAPWVLVSLVLFFGFRLWLEWRQCDAGRRRVLEARVDASTSFLIAALALGVFTYQQITRNQLFSSAHAWLAVALVLAMAASFMSWLLGELMWLQKRALPAEALPTRGKIGLVVTLVLTAACLSVSWDAGAYWTGACTACVLAGAVLANWLRRMVRPGEEHSVAATLADLELRQQKERQDLLNSFAIKGEPRE